MRLGLSVLVFVLASVIPATAVAQPAPVPDLNAHLRTGDTVYVLDTAAREITGVFGKVSDSAITMMVNGELRDIPFADVRRLTRRGRDSLWDGVLVGAAIGAVANGALQGFPMAIGGAIIYGAIGALIDKAVEGRVVVYRAPGKSIAVAPFVTDGQRGVRVAVRF